MITRKFVGIVLGFCLVGCCDTTDRSKKFTWYKDNCRAKLARVSTLLASFRELGFVDGDAAPLDVYFYTENQNSAQDLTLALARRGYEVGYGEKAINEYWFYTVEGSTTAIVLDEDSLVDWIVDMCDAGRQHGAMFEGWQLMSRWSERTEE